MLSHYIEKSLGIPRRYSEQVAQLYQEELLKKDEFLVRENGYCQKMIFIKDGYLRCHFPSKEKEITYWIYWEGHLVTDSSSFFLDVPAKWNLQALTDCTIYSISKTNYEQLQQLVPNWEHSEKRMIIQLLTSLEKRVYALLSMTAEERYQFLYQSHQELFNQIPLKFIASMLKITPETLSRIRRKHSS
ncbi:MAG: Crp/Fnr family transcriptional regulator [Bacteroidota bacterium]